MACSACVDAGPPKPSDYKEVGTFERLKARNQEMSCYVTGTIKPGKKVNAIVLIYDIFGWNKENRNVFRVADHLAKNGFFVLMPDFYRGEPWPLSRFPPKSEEDKKDFGKWWGDKCELKKTDTDIREAVVPFIRRFNKGVKTANIGLLGFCWGGLMCFGTAGLDKTFTYCCIGTFHGARLTPELASNIKCPALVCPSKDDPPYEDIKKVLDEKPFGKHCSYHNFTKQIHGFCAARGDWTDKDVMADAKKALEMMVEFYSKMDKY